MIHCPASNSRRGRAEETGRGRIERERAANGADSGLPDLDPVRKNRGEEWQKSGGGEGWSGGNRRMLRLARKFWAGHPTLKSGVQPPRRGAAVG